MTTLITKNCVLIDAHNVTSNHKILVSTEAKVPVANVFFLANIIIYFHILLQSLYDIPILL